MFQLIFNHVTHHHHLLEALSAGSCELHTESKCSNPFLLQDAPCPLTMSVMLVLRTSLCLVDQISEPRYQLDKDDICFKSYRNLLQSEFIEINQMVNNLKVKSVFIFLHNTVTSSMKSMNQE